MKTLLLAATAAIVAAASPAAATVYRLDVKGVVDYVDEYNTYASFRDNDPFTASITFDTQSFSAQYVTDDSSYYLGNITDFSYSLGSFDTSENKTGASIALNDTLANYDSFEVTTYRNTLLSPTGINGNVQERVILTLTDRSQNFLTGASLNQSLTNMGNISKLFSGRVQYVDDFGSAASFARLNISSGSITTIAASVPEPSTWALMMIGMGAVGYSLRRRRAKLAMA